MVKDLHFNIKIKLLPMVREENGLALSSRNNYLSLQEKKDALVLSQAIKLVKNLVKLGHRNASYIKKELYSLINTKKSLTIDYIEIVDKNCLQPIKNIYNSFLLALAVFIGKTRLVDNIIIRLKSKY